MKGFARVASIGVALTLFGLPMHAAEEGEAEAEDDAAKYIEVIIVRGERGDLNTLDRAMTVTGFNASMIQELGIQNTNDLEILTPGFQVGHRSQGGGKNEDGHIVMRGRGLRSLRQLLPGRRDGCLHRWRLFRSVLRARPGCHVRR